MILKKLLYSVILTGLMITSNQSIAAPVPGATTDPVAACKDQVPFGAPVSNDKSKSFITICHTGYLSHYDENAHVPDWVSYTLTQFGLLGCNDRAGPFKKDPMIPPVYQASPSDYDAVGYDRGHLANAQDMKYDPEVEAESFYMTNMTPQKPSFNRGIWKNLEDTVRSWSAFRDGDNLTIISGPIYNISKDSKFGKSKVDVPDGFFKIVIDDDKKDAIAFKFDDQNKVIAAQDLAKQRSSISDIEKATNITFPVPTGVDKTKVSDMWPTEQGQYKKEHDAACKK